MTARDVLCDCGSSIFFGRGTPSCPHIDFDSCTRASEPAAPEPDRDLSPILQESIERERASKCVTCGDALDPADPDNFLRPAGFNKAGRTDCGTCVRGMRGAS